MTRRIPMRIDITLYYPASLTLSEDVSLIGDDFQPKVENLEEPTIQIEPMPSSASARIVDPLSQQSHSPLHHPSPSTLDPGTRPIATSSAVSVASSTRLRQPDKRQAAKKSRGGGVAVGAGDRGGSSGGEEQVLNYVVERFDDDVRLDSAPPPPPPSSVDPSSPKDDRKSPPKKRGKKGQQEVSATEKPADDAGVKKPMMTEDELRRVAAEQLWNAERSSGARCNVDSLTR